MRMGALLIKRWWLVGMVWGFLSACVGSMPGENLPEIKTRFHESKLVQSENFTTPSPVEDLSDIAIEYSPPCSQPFNPQEDDCEQLPVEVPPSPQNPTKEPWEDRFNPALLASPSTNPNPTEAIDAENMEILMRIEEEALHL